MISVTVTRDAEGAVALTIYVGSRRASVRLTPDGARRIAAELMLAADSEIEHRRDERGRYVDA